MINLIMKRLPLIGSLSLTSLVFLAQATSVFAATDITIVSPRQGIGPNANVGFVFSNIITIIFVVAVLMVLLYLILGAFGWITSGGDKEKVGKARGMILNALIGLAVLALAFVLWTIVGKIVNVNTSTLSLPGLGDDPTTKTAPAVPGQ
jgi:hypothetical protein